MVTRSEGEIEPDIYVRSHDPMMGRGGKDPYEWYVIKGDSTTPEYEFLLPQLTPLPHHFVDAAHASLGSTIYLCGGREDHIPTNEVYYVDTCRPNDGWKKASPMNAVRERHYAFTYQEMIYVVGGINHHTLDNLQPPPWAEVYDPTRDTWRALPHIPNDFIMGPIKGHSVSGNKILFVNDSLDSFIFYNMELEQWGILSNAGASALLPYPFHRYTLAKENSPAFMDGMIYFEHDRIDYALYAYDVSKPGRFPKAAIVDSIPQEFLLGSDVGAYADHRKSHSIISLGNGKLAVVSSRDTYNEEHGHFLGLYCTIFKIMKVENSIGELEIQTKLVHSSSHYIQGRYLDICLAGIGPETQEVRDPTTNNKIWTIDEDSKLLEAFRVLRVLGNHNLHNVLEPGLLKEVEKILNVTLPKSRPKTDLVIKSRIETLKSKINIVHDTVHGPRSNGFPDDDATKYRVTNKFGLDENNERDAALKDRQFFLYRELCGFFREDLEDAESPTT